MKVAQKGVSVIPYKSQKKDSLSTARRSHKKEKKSFSETAMKAEKVERFLIEIGCQNKSTKSLKQ